MAEPNDDAPKATPKPDSEVVTTRVNVAFPFSQIKVEQPSEDVAELAVLVHELAELLVDLAPESKARELVKRAQSIATRLR